MTPRFAALLVVVACSAAHAATKTITENVSLTLASAAKLSSPATLTLTVSGTTFNNFSGSLLVNYKARTTQVGSATLTLKANSDFSPSGGPTVASGNVTYTCASAGLGTACSGTQTMSTTSQTSVVSISTNACVGTGCPSANPASITLQFVLANNPQYKTGSYSAQVLFTFSST